MAQARTLAGRVALVIGGSRGIGAGIAVALAEHGADVAVNYQRSPDAAKQVVAAVEAAGARGVALGADASVESEVAALVEQAAEALGDVDILVCNAAGQTDGAVERYRSGRTDAVQSAREVLDRTATQLAASLLPAREVLPGMRRKGGGSIVFVGATASRGRPLRGTGEITVAKAAQDALARVLAVELGPNGVRVNTVAPGMVPTDANAGPHQEAMIKEFEKTTPLGRVGAVEDVANVVVHLASDLSRHVTGAYIGVDGGNVML